MRLTFFIGGCFCNRHLFGKDMLAVLYAFGVLIIGNKSKKHVYVLFSFDRHEAPGGSHVVNWTDPEISFELDFFGMDTYNVKY